MQGAAVVGASVVWVPAALAQWRAARCRRALAPAGPARQCSTPPVAVAVHGLLAHVFQHPFGRAFGAVHAGNKCGEEPQSVGCGGAKAQRRVVGIEHRGLVLRRHACTCGRAVQYSAGGLGFMDAWVLQPAAAASCAAGAGRPGRNHCAHLRCRAPWLPPGHCACDARCTGTCCQRPAPRRRQSPRSPCTCTACAPAGGVDSAGSQRRRLDMLRPRPAA